MAALAFLIIAKHLAKKKKKNTLTKRHLAATAGF